MTAPDLARLTLKVLDKQQEYFRGRNGTVLAECRDLERRLRDACVEIVNPPRLTLFKEESDAPQS